MTSDDLDSHPDLQGLFDTAPQVIDVTSLANDDLLDHYNNCDTQLLAIRQVRFPRTQEGREIHSFRAALRVEMLKRGLT